MNYLDNLKTYDKYGRRSLYETLSLNANIPEDWEVISREYQAVDIDKVEIDGNVFTNYGQYQFIYEKTFVKEPKRGGRGNLGNLNSYATFLTPHLIMDFSIMPIDDYRAIMRLHYDKNEYTVKCYDTIYNKPLKAKMYFATEQMAKLYTINKTRFKGNGEWEDFIMLAGVREYTVELIGTNNDLNLVSVTYHLNPPSDTGYNDQTIGEEDVYQGEEIIIGGATDFQTETFGGLYKFKKWNISPSGGNIGNYIDGFAYTINADLVLYAQWESATEHTLTFNYGVADPIINNSNNEYEQSRTVVQYQSIGALPIPEMPFVEVNINGTTQKYYPYSNGNWYRIPQLTNNAQNFIVNNNETYWSNKDDTIYWLYNVNNYAVYYYVDGELHSSNLYVEYNTQIPLPQLVKSGYTFDGWYTTSDFQEDTKANGKMPPYAISLYARWVENE